jgi:hypothetical protein
VLRTGKKVGLCVCIFIWRRIPSEIISQPEPGVVFEQGTFREHSGNIQGTFREHSGPDKTRMKGTTFREYAGQIGRKYEANRGQIGGKQGQIGG